MATRNISELANWDGHQRRNPRWRRSSSTLGRDPYHPPLENQLVDVFQPPGKLSDKKRVEQSASRSNRERNSLVNSPANSSANARLHSRIDTTSTPSHDIYHSHQASIAVNPPLFPYVHSSSRSAQHSAPNSAFQSSSFIASSKSAHRTPNSSVHASRVHNLRLRSSYEPFASSQSASAMESEVIDLTLEDTDHEMSVSDMLVPNGTNNPDPSRRTLSSGHSSPIALEQSLFTPPPLSKRRTRWVIDYLAVPPLPKGLTKADYQPLLDHSVVPLPSPTVLSTLRDSALVEPLVMKRCTPVDSSVMLSPAPTMTGTLSDFPLAATPVIKEHTTEQRESKEWEVDAVSRGRYKQRSLAIGEDVVSNALLDTFCEHTMVPLYDDDTYPLLTTLDLVTNARFQFAHAWREYASKLQEAELEWMYKFNLLGKTCIWARSVNASSPRSPGTAGYVSSKQLRPWELAPPDSPPQENSTEYDLDERAHTSESHVTVQADPNYLLLPDDALHESSAAFDPALSTSTVSQGPAIVDMEHDMHRYFNELGDSPAKHVPPRQQLTPTHTFRPHFLQPAGLAQMNTLEMGLDLDPRLADTGDRECFFGVPPSPPPVDMESLVAPEAIVDPPSQPANYNPASQNNVFEASPTDAWLFEQGESSLLDNDSPPTKYVTPATLGTIDPSLLGPGQSPNPSQAPKDSTPKRRSKLPEPIIYIRRPVDSSGLPSLAGKRSVQIKYRASGGSPSTPSTRIGSNEAPSNFVGASKQPKSDTDDPPRAKRRSIPSRKLQQYNTASVSDSDYVPETSTPRVKLKPKRPSLRDKEAVFERDDVEAETISTMSFCHQCRHTSDRPKMLCSNMIHGRVCGKRFCNRCILYRYPDITFDERSASFLCPACTNTCNCSACARSRGEEFISMRLGGLAASLLKAKVTLVRDIGKPLHHARSPSWNGNVRQSASVTLTPTPEQGAPSMGAQFWAYVYGLEGERMGSAFMTRENMERLQTRPSPLPKQALKKARKPRRYDKEREKPRGPRVFIGHPLASWKIRAVRDLEPSVNVETKDRGKSKEEGTATGITSGDPRRRCFIGNPVPLYEPYGRMPWTASPTPPPSSCSTPALDSNGTLTPLSELEAEADDWPQPAVGEYCSWAPPPPLGTVVHANLSDPPALSSLELTGLAPPGSDVNMEMDGGDELKSASTVLSEQDLARAISAALAALTVDTPS